METDMKEKIEIMDNDVTFEYMNEYAIKIINDNIAKYMKKYATAKDNKESNILKEKIDVLEKLKNEVYFNNRNVIQNIIDKHKKGIL